jgi:predicted SAM-dependent methyltransferase
MKTLDLGCGKRPEHWHGDGLDYMDFGQKYVFNLEDVKRFPIADNEYDITVAFHILEHIKSPEAFINIMNEVWRVTKPGGIFKGAAPHYTSINYFRDPFHVRPMTENTFDGFLKNSPIYFNEYGIFCVYKPRAIFRNPNNDVCWELEIVK